MILFDDTLISGYSRRERGMETAAILIQPSGQAGDSGPDRGAGADLYCRLGGIVVGGQTCWNWPTESVSGNRPPA